MHIPSCISVIKLFGSLEVSAACAHIILLDVMSSTVFTQIMIQFLSLTLVTDKPLRILMLTAAISGIPFFKLPAWFYAFVPKSIQNP